MKKSLVELMKINNVLSKEYENFFLGHIDEFLNNNEQWVVIMQQSRATGDVKGRRPDFTTYYEDIKKKKINNTDVIYCNESIINVVWDYICGHEENKTYIFGDELWTEIDICPGGFLFFNKIGIKLILLTREVYKEIMKTISEHMQNWFNDNYEKL